MRLHSTYKKHPIARRSVPVGGVFVNNNDNTYIALGYNSDNHSYYSINVTTGTLAVNRNSNPTVRLVGKSNMVIGELTDTQKIDPNEVKAGDLIIREGFTVGGPTSNRFTLHAALGRNSEDKMLVRNLHTNDLYFIAADFPTYKVGTFTFNTQVVE